VATWCPSCQAGTQAVAGQAARLRAAGVQVVEVEDHADLGQPGPGIAAFGRQFAGAAYRDPGWTFGTASQAFTRAWNPQGYLDVYFLLGSSGKVAYINSAPASTMSQLLAHAGGRCRCTSSGAELGTHERAYIAAWRLVTQCVRWEPFRCSGNGRDRGAAGGTGSGAVA